MQKPLSEYPRPQFYRESYISLNGEWDYKISKNREIPDVFDGKILVPYSPETSKSGVLKTLHPDEYLFYKLNFQLPEDFVKDIVYLNFLAADQIADVFVNGKEVFHHEGGFLPFKFDIKPYLKKENTIIVRVQDYTDTSYLSRGKQRLKHGGIWYTPQSGIYFPVFLESVPYNHVESIKITPDIDHEEVIIRVQSKAEEAICHIFGVDRPLKCNFDNHIKVKNMHLWSTEDPYLYFFRVSVDEDEVNSYFAMRKISVKEDKNGYKRIALNNKPIFMKGVLDQGYYKDGLLTPSSYEDYVKDIDLVKSLGFNTIRKHIKIEIPRWYFECDKKGILVWQDFVNGGTPYKLGTITLPLITNNHQDDSRYKKFSRDNDEGRKKALEEFKQTMEYLHNSPCIVLWTIFNEGWGQFDAKEVYKELNAIDNTRLFDHASGWHDQGVSDVKSLHVYFKKVKIPEDKNRAVVLSEFGGLVLPIKGHYMKGNHVYTAYKDENKYVEAYKKMIERDVINNIPSGLSASIYTQLSDVEEECNGFVTFDREVMKVDVEEIKKINDKITL